MKEERDRDGNGRMKGDLGRMERREKQRRQEGRKKGRKYRN